MEETVAENCRNKKSAIKELRSLGLVKLRTTTSKQNFDVGFTFPSTSPWVSLVAKYITELGFRPLLGDWGGGNGHASLHLMLAGANPYLIDSSLDAAKAANNLLYYTGKKYLPEGVKASKSYKVGPFNVGHDISPKFLERLNHINVCFNIAHYLTPLQSDIFFNNLYANTRQGGIVVLSADTPFGRTNTILTDHFQKGVEKGLKYPGFGLFSLTNIAHLTTGKKLGSIDRRAHTPTSKELKSKRMGVYYKGIFPIIGDYDHQDDGRTLKVDGSIPVNHPLNILGHNKFSYAFITSNSLHNYFNFPVLKRCLEESGFVVINGWYANHDSPDLYPYDPKNPGVSQKSKVVIVAQKK